jgi:hypothetical protein
MFWLFRFSFTTWNNDIQSIHFIDLEFMFNDLLFKCMFIDDTVVSIDQMFFDFMRNNTFYNIYPIWFNNFSNGLCDLIVNISWFEESESSLDTFVSS